MSSEFLPPSRYQSQAQEWRKTYAGSVPDAHQVILSNRDLLAKVQERSLAWANDYIDRFQLEGWTLEEQAEIEESFAGQLILVRFTLKNPDNPQLGGENVYSKDASGAQVNPLYSSHASG